MASVVKFIRPSMKLKDLDNQTLYKLEEALEHDHESTWDKLCDVRREIKRRRGE